jgi:hypothetical protein
MKKTIILGVLLITMVSYSSPEARKRRAGTCSFRLHVAPA